MVGVVYIKSQQNGVTYVNEEHPHPTLSRTNFRADSESGNQSPFKKMTLKGFFMRFYVQILVIQQNVSVYIDGILERT